MHSWWLMRSGRDWRCFWIISNWIILWKYKFLLSTSWLTVRWLLPLHSLFSAIYFGRKSWFEFFPSLVTLIMVINQTNSWRKNKSYKIRCFNNFSSEDTWEELEKIIGTSSFWLQLKFKPIDLAMWSQKH